MWQLRLPWVAPGDLEAQLVELLDRLPNDPVRWARLDPTWRRDFFCGLDMHESDCGLELSPATLERMGRIDATFGFCAYFTADDDEEE